MQQRADMAGFRSLFVSASDGLKLHVREYGERHWPTTPVLCLPGLARTGADFHDLALRLSSDGTSPRRVLACDMRGRGLSQYDKRHEHYDVAVETADVLAIMAATGLHKPVVIGASRGGLQIMALAAMRPTAIAAAVLLDIGPVIDGKGLLRIKAYVGKIPAVADLDEAVALLKRIAGAQFPAWSEAQWRVMAERSFKRGASGLVPDYDPALVNAFGAIDLEAPLPSFWPHFEALAFCPLLAVRGETSDLLSPATLAEMGRRHPNCETVTIPGEGHVPDVGSPSLREHIVAFVTALDQRS